VSCFPHSLIVEELSSTSGVLPDNFEFSNCLKVKIRELSSSPSFYQFKYIFSQEEVGFLNLLVSKELLDWQSILTN
jgi:hypothetical protein